MTMSRLPLTEWVLDDVALLRLVLRAGGGQMVVYDYGVHVLLVGGQLVDVILLGPRRRMEPPRWPQP